MVLDIELMGTPEITLEQKGSRWDSLRRIERTLPWYLAIVSRHEHHRTIRVSTDIESVRTVLNGPSLE